MSFSTIRNAQKEVWPAVRRSLSINMRKRQEVAERGPRSESERIRQTRPWDQVVADETVWGIAKADLLATPEQAAVVKAARDWLKATGPYMAAYPEDYYTEDWNLRDAVNAYLTSLAEIDDTEPLRPSEIPATVPPVTTN